VNSLTVIRPLARAGLLALAAGLAALAQTSPSAAISGKVAVIEIQAAIFQTQDGKKALADLQAKFNPVKQRLETKRADIAKNEDALRKGANTMSDEAKQKLARDIDTQTKSLNRDTDDANADLEQENQRLMNDLGGKMMAVINKYASEKGYVIVLDVSAQNTPVLWASNTIDITRDVIAAYDANAGNLTPSTSVPKSGITNMPTAAPVQRRPAAIPPTKQ